MDAALGLSDRGVRRKPTWSGFGWLRARSNRRDVLLDVAITPTLC